MLRSTQPLDTLPPGPVEEERSFTVQYYEIPPNLSDSFEIERRCIESMRFPWKGWTVRIRNGLMWFDWPQSCLVREEYAKPEITIRVDGGGTVTMNPPPAFVEFRDEPILEFKCNSIGSLHPSIPANAFLCQDDGESTPTDSRLLSTYQGFAITIPAGTPCGAQTSCCVANRSWCSLIPMALWHQLLCGFADSLITTDQ
jgi:hypothetical protein